MPYFNHDGLNFYFEEHGSGIPLLFSHGLSGSLNQAKELVGSSTGIRLIVYDSRGHGKTGQAGDIDQLNFSTMAADAAVLLDGRWDCTCLLSQVSPSRTGSDSGEARLVK